MSLSPLLADRTHQPLTQEGFDTLAVQWLMGLGPSSDPREMTAHPAFKAIVATRGRRDPVYLASFEAKPKSPGMGSLRHNRSQPCEALRLWEPPQDHKCLVEVGHNE